MGFVLVEIFSGYRFLGEMFLTIKVFGDFVEKVFIGSVLVFRFGYVGICGMGFGFWLGFFVLV